MANEQPEHSVCDIGNLEDRLAVLAMIWRTNIENRNEIKKEYHEIVALLFSLDWNDYIDLESELPDEHMPKEYKNRQLLNKE